MFEKEIVSEGEFVENSKVLSYGVGLELMVILMLGEKCKV